MTIISIIVDALTGLFLVMLLSALMDRKVDDLERMRNEAEILMEWKRKMDEEYDRKPMHRYDIYIPSWGRDGLGEEHREYLARGIEAKTEDEAISHYIFSEERKGWSSQHLFYLKYDYRRDGLYKRDGNERVIAEQID